MTPKQIKAIYQQYHLPQTLQQHMLRVGALAALIVKNWQGPPIDKQAIIQVCLFHDIAKPMSFDYSKRNQFSPPPKQFKKLKDFQKIIKQKYGSNEHQATVKIFEAIDCSPQAIKLINNFEWHYTPRLFKSKEIESLIPIYCDMRIGPKGILSFQDRFKEIVSRRPDKKPEIVKIKPTIQKLETLLQSQTSIDLTAITNKQIKKELNSFT